MKYLNALKIIIFCFLTYACTSTTEKEVILYEIKKDGKWGWYKDGDTEINPRYSGEILNGKPNGKGSILFPDGAEYHGELKNGKLNGYGKYSYHHGDIYEGEWLDNKKHGKGKYKWGKSSKWSGDEFDGQWYENKEHGYGKYTSSNGNIYQGQWKNGMQTGRGTWITSDRFYSGYFLNDKLNGIGVMIRSNGEQAIGWWKDGNQINVHYYKETGKYIGSIIDGKKSNLENNENILFGRVKKGEPEWSLLQSPSYKAKYIGETKNEKPHGWGTLRMPGDRLYIGKFKNGKMNGFGITHRKRKEDIGIGIHKGTKPMDIIIYKKNGQIIGKYKKK